LLFVLFFVLYLPSPSPRFPVFLLFVTPSSRFPFPLSPSPHCVKKKKKMEAEISSSTNRKRSLSSELQDINPPNKRYALTDPNSSQQTPTPIPTSSSAQTTGQIKLLIQNNFVGNVIGKSGSSIKQIREESGASIIIAEAALVTNDREFTITGTLQATEKALTLIHQKLVSQSSFLQLQNNKRNRGVKSEENNENKENGDSEDSTILVVDSASPTKDLSLKLVIPNEQIGCIIGKAGNVIKQIREDSKARIEIPGEDRTRWARLVTISGESQSVLNALILICHKLLANPVRHSLNSFIFTPPFIHPSLVYSGASPIPSYSQSKNTAARIHSQLPLSNSQQIPNQHHHHHHHHQQQKEYNSSYAGFGGLPPSSSIAAMTPTSTTITVPNNVMARVIGKGGASINEIRKVSGCRIEISDHQSGSNDRIVSFHGTPNAVEMAHFLVTSKIYGSR